MQTKKEIEDRVALLLKDERLYYPAATVFENAPLALIQLSMETQIHALQSVLKIKRTDFNKLRAK